MKGCKNCPAYAKCTVTYRGSACAALRSTYGIDTDPEIITNADRIRDMSDEELAEFLKRVHVDPCSACCDNLYWCRRNNAPEPVCQKHFFKWLQQLYEGE